jgi:hypothetical protein
MHGKQERISRAPIFGVHVTVKFGVWDMVPNVRLESRTAQNTMPESGLFSPLIADIKIGIVELARQMSAPHLAAEVI